MNQIGINGGNEPLNNLNYVRSILVAENKPSITRQTTNVRYLTPEKIAVQNQNIQMRNIHEETGTLQKNDTKTNVNLSPNKQNTVKTLFDQNFLKSNANNSNGSINSSPENQQQKVEKPTIQKNKIQEEDSGDQLSINLKREYYIQQLGQSNYEFANIKYWTRTEFRWDQLLIETNKQIFGNLSFRQNQKAIINCTMSKRDVFLCMPTGGGKSLTFQLPAVIEDGVTLVIMPLISLIHDQVAQLNNKGINAKALTANQNWEQIKLIMDEFNMSPNYPKMLFLTPEKLSQSDCTMTFLEDLYIQKKLSRIVVDEAHCVSNWGRDFRPAYLNLGIVKDIFKGVPVMALTATATEQVKIDVIDKLKMVQCLYFQSSFNRPNLIYEVRNKANDVLDDIAVFIKKNYHKKCGLIYCTTRNDCEKVAEYLKKKHNINAGFYHAESKDREKVQDAWMQDEVHIIVATIAFGMGINKPDVRFVIHYCLSKSIENYYQESGRAGRDGLKSHCVIYYTYKDKGTLQFLIKQNKGNNNSGKSINVDQLNQMVKYCEDQFMCRRQMQLAYLGEKFEREACGKQCDNCVASRLYIEKDFTKEAKQIVKFVQGGTCEVTFKQLRNILKGTKSSKDPKKFQECSAFGKLEVWQTQDIEAVMKELIFNNYLTEVAKDIYNRTNFYLEVNQSNVKKLLEDQEKFIVKLQNTNQKKNSTSSAVNIIEKNNQKINLNNYAYKQQNDQEDKNIQNQQHQQLKMRVIQLKDTGDQKENNFRLVIDQFVFDENKNKVLVDTIEIQSTTKNVFNEEFGYCNEEQYQEILDRLKIVRKRIFNLMKNKIEYQNNPENLFPTIGLQELAKKLPTENQELTIQNIRYVGAQQLKAYGPKFLEEIKHFINSNSIKKQEYVYPQKIQNRSPNEEDIFDIKEHQITNSPFNYIFNIDDYDNVNFEEIIRNHQSNQQIQNNVNYTDDDIDEEFDMDEIDRILENHQQTEKQIKGVEEPNQKKRQFSQGDNYLNSDQQNAEETSKNHMTEYFKKKYLNNQQV